MLCRSVYYIICMHALHAKLSEAPSKKAHFKLPDLTPPRVLKLESYVLF